MPSRRPTRTQTRSRTAARGSARGTHNAMSREMDTIVPCPVAQRRFLQRRPDHVLLCPHRAARV
eukprot:6654161-Pyramimonas_sp.AAC.1